MTDAAGRAASDTELLAAHRAGDDHALELLLERHAPAVLRFGLKMCRDPEDAADVLQETLLAAARGVRDFRGDASLTTWLYAIARSFCLKKHRRATPPATSLDDDAATEVMSPLAAPDEVAAEREVGAALSAAVDALAPSFREVLLLRDVEGLTAPEVAEVLGIGVEAVKSRLHRARVAVRERLAPLLIADPVPRGPGCPEIAPVLSRYLEGDIGPADCKAMDRHVSACSHCRAECDSLRRVLTLCQQERTDALPASVQAAVKAALRAPPR